MSALDLVHSRWTLIPIYVCDVDSLSLIKTKYLSQSEAVSKKCTKQTILVSQLPLTDRVFERSVSFLLKKKDLNFKPQSLHLQHLVLI